MFNITKFKQIVSPVLLLASILLFNNLTLAAAIGGPGVAVVALRTIDQDLLDATRDGDGAAVVQALAAGADVNTRYNDGWTALMEAAWRGHTAIATQLLAAGADVNASNNDDWTVLMLAVWRGHAAIATQLLAAGADVHTRNNNGWTALIIATTNGHTAIVTQLLTAGADVNARNNGGVTALISAAWNENTEVLAQLLAAGAEIPEHLQTNATILALPEALRNTPALLRALTSSYNKQAVKAFRNPDIIAILTASDLSAIDFAQHKFIINPNVQILPDVDLLATGATRAAGEFGPEILPEAFSILDLAILSCQPALVDQLLMSGLSPAHLTQQTRGLLERFPAPGGGAREAKGADDHAMTAGEVATVAESEQIAHMIYYATMAHTTEVQDRVRGLPSSCDTTEPLPKIVKCYATATKEFRAWAKTQTTTDVAAAAHTSDDTKI